MSWLRARFSDRRSTWRAALASLVVLTAVTAALDGLVGIRHGLKARYFDSTTWTGPIAATGVDPDPSTASVFRRRARYGDEPFSVEWRGFLEVPRAGTYTLATISDDGSEIWVDLAQVVDNGGDHPPTEARGRVALDAGPHAVVVRFYQHLGGYELRVLWAFESEPLAPIPASAFVVSPTTRTQRLASPALHALRLVVLVAWYAAFAAALVTLGRWAWSRLRRVAHPGLPLLLAGSLALNAGGVWWGIPASWAADELIPQAVLGGFARHFSLGWFDKYPPFHYYLLLVAMAPVRVWFWLTGQSPTVEYALLLLSERLLSVAMGVATVLAVYLCATEVASRRAAMFAAALAATMAPFVYYAKVANTDIGYFFWSMLSLVFFARLLRDDRLRDYVWLAVTAALAVCSKDQAYGLYVLTPLAIVWVAWHRPPASGGARALAGAAVNRKTLLALAAFVAVFAACHNLLFNWEGFVAHVEEITGSASQSYRMFAQTWRGQAELLWLSVRLMQHTFGWPAFLLCVGGLGYALVRPPRPALLLWLLVPAASYYLTFIAVVGYSYDRFMIPIGFVLAVAGGWALDRWLASGWGPQAMRAGIVAGVLGFGVYYAGLVDVTMALDSRYTVEAWVRDHVRPGQRIGMVSPATYLPRLDGFDLEWMSYVEDVEAARPAFVVVNADYGTREPGSSTEAMYQALAGGALGYRRVFDYRTPTPRLPLAHPDLAGPRGGQKVYSNLYHINPRIEIFERDR